jgi:hypothetical protein
LIDQYRPDLIYSDSSYPFEEGEVRFTDLFTRRLRHPLLLLMIKFLMPETKGRTIEEIERSWLKH